MKVNEILTESVSLEQLTEEFDLIESIINRLAEHNGVDAEVIWEDLESLTEDELYAFAVTSEPIMESQHTTEALGLYGPFTVTINTGERPQSRTKTKKFRREDDAILWAQDWLEDAPQYVFATAEVTDPDGNVVWTTDEQGVAEGTDNIGSMIQQYEDMVELVYDLPPGRKKNIAIDKRDELEAKIEAIPGGKEALRQWAREYNDSFDEGVAEGEKKPHPETWHDVDKKLGKAVDKMSQAEKVKKGLAHPDTLKKKGVAEGSLEEVSLDLAKRARDKSEHMVDMDYDDMRDRPYGYSEKQRSKFQRYIDRKEPRAKGDRDWDPPKQGVAEDWQKANKQDRTAGMSQKAVNAYRRENPGSKLKTAVTTKPSKLKRGSKASKRRKSYCSRSRGQMKMHSISCSKTPDKAICKARRRWNC